MKTKFLLVGFFIFIGIQSYGQNQVSNLFLNTQVGTAFTGTGDMLGISLMDELGWHFNKKISISAYTELQNFNDQTINMGMSYLNIGTNLYYSFNILHNNKLEIGVGAFSRYTNARSFDSYSLSNFNNTNIATIYPHSPIWSVGYYTSLGLEVPIKDWLAITLKLSLQNDTEGDITETLKTGLKIFI